MSTGEAFYRRGSAYPRPRSNGGAGAASGARGVSTADAPARPVAAGPQHPGSRIDPATSPLVDREGDGWVLSESTSPVLHLSASRRRFLAGAAATGRRPIIVTGENSVLTLALAEALQSLGGAWVVATAAGFRDTRMGRRIASPEVVFEPDFAPVTAPEHARQPDAETSQISVLASVRQRNRRTARYGGAVELLADLLVDDAALDWGVAEPTTVPWDAEQVASYGRESLAHTPWLIVNGVGATGHAVTGTLRLQPTKQGSEEIINLVADVGPEGGEEAAEAFADAPAILGELVTEGVPLIAIAFATVGRADLHRGPTLERPGVPLAMLVGAPGVSRLGLPLDELVRRFDAEIVGAARSPAVVVPLGDGISPANVERMREVLWAMEPLVLAEALGSEFIDPFLGPDWRAEAAERAAAAESDAPAHPGAHADSPAPGAEPATEPAHPADESTEE